MTAPVITSAIASALPIEIDNPADPRLTFLHQAHARLVLVEAGEVNLDTAVADLMPPCPCARETVAMWEREYPPRQWQRASRRPTSQATVEAIIHAVRQRGVAALKEPANIERLSRCDADAKAAIETRIAKFKSKKDFD